MGLFMGQHAMVHSAGIFSSTTPPVDFWSFEDELWQGLSEEAARFIPQNEEHSIAWMIWHIARIEDITMNLLVAGRPQVFSEGLWQERMRVKICDTGSAMNADEIASFSTALDMQALRAYRTAVGCRTREIVSQVEAKILKQKVDPARLKKIVAERAVVEAASWLVDYWGGRSIAGLLMMPATRHNFVHLNEAMRMKQMLQKALS
jgi:hypothetical protein